MNDATDNGLGGDATYRLFDRIHELLGAPPAAGAVPEPAEGGALDALAERARVGGLGPSVFEAPLDAVMSSLTAERPLLTLDGEGQALLLAGRLGARVRIEDGVGRHRWADVAALRERLGLDDSGQGHPWLGFDGPSLRAVGLEAEAAPWTNAWTLVRAEGANVGVIVIYAVGVGILSLALPLAVQALVNTVAFGQLMQPIVVLTLLLAGGLIFAAGLRAMQAWMVEVVQRRIFVRLVSELAGRMPRVHVDAFERGHGPELVNRFFDVFTAQKSIASLLLGGVEALLTVLVGLVVLALYHPILLAFGLILLLASLAVFVLLGRGATRTTIAESKAKYAVAGWLEEMARHLFALKMAGGGDYARRRLDELAATWLRNRAAHFRVYFRQFVGALGLQVVAHATLLGIGGWLVVQRELSIGQLVAAELIVTAVVASLSKLGGKLEAVYDLVAAADKLGVLLGIPLEADDGEDPVFGGRAAEAVFDRVTSAGREFVDFDLHIRTGSTVALLGNRRMATALVELLFGLRAPTRGAIRVDGQDLRDVRLDALRSHIAVVREPEVLPGTVADNVRAVGRPVTASEIWRVLERVGLSDAIRALPGGLQTPLMPSGAPLGRLAALRLTVARALAAQPALMVLDGVIDALPEHERRQLLMTCAHDRTLVVLTHERAVAKRCDRVVELEAIVTNAEQEVRS